MNEIELTEEERQELKDALLEMGIKPHHKWKDSTLVANCIEAGILADEQLQEDSPLEEPLPEEVAEENEPEEDDAPQEVERKQLDQVLQKIMVEVMDGDARAVVREYMSINTGEEPTKVLENLMDDLSRFRRGDILAVVQKYITALS
jgi:hypothetical protein